MTPDERTTTRAGWPDAERDPMYVTAADWVGRLSNSNVSVEDTLAWQEWMKADARHSEAFHRFEQISHALKDLQPPPAASRRQWANDTYDASVPLSEWQTQNARGVFSRHAFKGPWTLAAAAAIALIAGAAVLMNLGRNLWSHPDKVLTTRVGENRTVNLADGSTVMLGGATRLEWSFDDKQRSLELIQGEALFKVAKDVARPFKVRAGNADVVALGTAFNVRRRSDRTIVAVTDGRVIVEPVAHLLPVAMLREFKPKLRPVHVDAGEQTTAGSEGIEQATRVKDLAAMTSWQTGRLSFRLQPLRYVLEDVNRYARKPVTVADASVGSLVVSGTVIGDSIDGWVESLEHAFGLVAVEEDDRIVLKGR